MKLLDCLPLPWVYDYPCITDDDDTPMYSIENGGLSEFDYYTDALEDAGKMMATAPYLVASLLRSYKSFSNILEFKLLAHVHDEETRLQMKQIESVLTMAGVEINELSYYIEKINEGGVRVERRRAG